MVINGNEKGSKIGSAVGNLQIFHDFFVTIKILSVAKNKTENLGKQTLL
jgi:hypothetical protein